MDIIATYTDAYNNIDLNQPAFDPQTKMLIGVIFIIIGIISIYIGFKRRKEIPYEEDLLKWERKK